MKTFEIWMEGFSATGQSQDAQFIGKANGETFEDACRNFKYPKDSKDWQGKIIIHEGDKLKFDMYYGYPTIWACRLYDNETDARKSFG